MEAIDIGKFVQIIPCQDETDVPVPRSGHRCVTSDSNFYSLGGYNPDYWDTPNTDETYYPLFKELWKFNFITRRWKKLQTKGYMPVELASHSALLLHNDLLVFGGTGVPFGHSSSNRLYCCNLKSLEWTELPCSGIAPQEEYGQAMLLSENYLYVCGGTTGLVYNLEMFRLHLKKLEWENLTVEPSPPGRYRHEIATDGKRIYILGGGTSVSVSSLKKLASFNLETRCWEDLPTHPSGNIGFPKARRCHSCVQHENNVYLCGGYNGEEIFGDVWRLHLPTLQWFKLKVEMPVPVYFHAAAISPSGCMTIFGGVSEIDSVRTADLYQIWLVIPSLKVLAWQKVIKMIPNIHEVPKRYLLQVGIPRELVDQIGHESDSEVQNTFLAGNQSCEIA